MLVFVLALMALALGCAQPAHAEPIAPARVQVLDGDTIRVDGSRPDVRLVGFNAPERFRAECPAERDLGERATRRVRELVNGGGLELNFVACSCPAGTEGTPACNYGRRCGVLRLEAGMLARCSLPSAWRCRSSAARLAAPRRLGRGAASRGEKRAR
jgi:hypothetical protein